MAHRLGDLVGGEKTDAVNVTRQAVRIAFNNPNRLVAILFVDFGRQARADAIALQKKHDFFDCALLGPSALDGFGAPASDTRHFDQPLRRLLDHIQRVNAKVSDDAPRRFGADAADQPAAQILFHARDRGGQHFNHLFDGELPAIVGVHRPASTQFDAGPHMHAQHVADDGDLTFGRRRATLRKFGQELGHRIAVLFIVIGDAFDHPAQRIHGGSVPDRPAFVQ